MKEAGKTIARLLKSDVIAAEQEFNKLTVDEQVRLFLDSDDRLRLKLVEISHTPRSLVEKIPATEIWFTIKTLTPHDSIPLIKYSTPEQLQVVCDIEWWKKDRLDGASIAEWLEYISECGIEKVMEWFSMCDWDQIQWFFKENVVVYKKAEKDDDPAGDIKWPREESPMTYEGVYYFQVLDEARDQLIRHFLEILAKHDHDLYRSICEVCIWEIQSIREEAAYEVKCRRLAEHGLPSFDEAVSVYSPLDKEKIKAVPKRTKMAGTFIAPRYPLAVIGDKAHFVSRVIAGADEAVRDRFLLELSSIANKMLIADGKGIDHEGLKRALRRAVENIDAGLEALSGGDVSKALSLLDEYWLVTFFQVGLAETGKGGL